MFDLDNWQEIWVTITRNKIRSILTGFGVFWGIFMLIILIGIGNGFKGGINKVVDGFAPNSCFFWSENTSEAYKGFRKGRSWTINNRDLELIRQKARSVEYISPTLFGNQSDKNVVRGQKSGSYTIKGIYPAQFMLEKQNILYGRVINDIDVHDMRKVCVIGKEIYETLFEKGEDPIGNYIRVNGIYFQVIGVVSPISQIQVGGESQTTVALPFNTMQQAFNTGDVIHFVGCTAKPGYPASVVEQEVKDIVKKNHDISPTDEKAMGSFNAEKEFLMFQNLFLGVDFLILFVGLGALLSGIIGISNIMLVTVRERTREIGVRRALGAKPPIIVKQILSESLVLTTIFGLMGFVFGVFILEVVRKIMTMGGPSEGFFIPPFVSFNTAIAALSILVVAGLMAGLLPALRALSIKAIDAIREE